MQIRAQNPTNGTPNPHGIEHAFDTGYAWGLRKTPEFGRKYQASDTQVRAHCCEAGALCGLDL